MAVGPTSKVWTNASFADWGKALINVGTHALHGRSAFEVNFLHSCDGHKKMTCPRKATQARFNKDLSGLSAQCLDWIGTAK